MPISIPVFEPNSDSETTSDTEKDVILIKQPGDSSLGNIVFDNTLLKTHSMAGYFMTITPDNDGYLNVPDNLKVIKINKYSNAHLFGFQMGFFLTTSTSAILCPQID